MILKLMQKSSSDKNHISQAEDTKTTLLQNNRKFSWYTIYDII